MPKSSAVDTTASTSLVPALAPTPALEIGSGDIALPRLYMGQPQAEAVQDGRVPQHCLFLAQGKDDDEPQVIWEQDGGEGVLFHVLQMTRGKSLQVDGELRSWAYNDPEAPEDARVVYHYVIALPEVDPDVPVKFLLKGTSMPAAKKINFVLAQNVTRGPAHQLAFRLTVKPGKNDKGRYSVAAARQVEAQPEHVQSADKLARLIAGSATDTAGVSAGNVEPAI